MEPAELPHDYGPSEGENEQVHQTDFTDNTPSGPSQPQLPTRVTTSGLLNAYLTD